MIWFLEDVCSMFRGDWVDKMMASIITILGLVIAFFVLWFLYWAMDSWFVSKETGHGQIVGKEFIPEHTVSEYRR